MKFVFGTSAHNPHVQNMVRALDEAAALYAYVTSGVDVFRNPVLNGARRLAGAAVPFVERELRRRALTGIPADRVQTRWRWELPRVTASRLGCDERLVDWIWERGQLDLDRTCARLLARADAGGFFGVEYGALASLRAAKRLGKPSVVAFLSPHYRTLARHVDSEYEKYPELSTHKREYFHARTESRNERLDREAATADWIVTNSSFTTDSLVQAGVSATKILTVPLGGPAPVQPDALPRVKPAGARFAYVGPASVRKGAHHLLHAWKKVARPGMQLDFYGAMLLPDRVRNEALSGPGGASLTFHGSVPASDLTRVYLDSSVLVLPTLCDGFGMVVSEALAHGLPVITTRNAGAADAIAHGRTGFIIPPADPDALAGVMTWCADHPDELFAMRLPALAAAGRWTWTDFRQRFIELLSGTAMNDGSVSRPQRPPREVAV